jgi:hypothetical protein
MVRSVDVQGTAGRHVAWMAITNKAGPVSRQLPVKYPGQKEMHEQPA